MFDRLSRRRLLLDAGAGFGWLAFRSLAEGAAHFAPRAKRVIQLFCAGGMSHVDTFDFKPELSKRDGKPYEMPTFFGQAGNLFGSPWEFRQRGQSGLWVSGLLPHLADCADKLTVVRTMSSKSANHMPAIAQMNTGFILTGFPSMGAWVLYGLGSESSNLPAYVVLPDHRGVPWGGSVHWTNSFLPASVQGTAFRATGDPVPDLSSPAGLGGDKREAGLEWLSTMNSHYAEANADDSSLEARLKTYELAARMQITVPEITDLKGETEATRRLYGIDRKETAEFGKRCLLARRLAERGVRFIQAYCGGSGQSWDAHQDIENNHPKMAIEYDQPAAALVCDLDARGMLADTLVMGVTEFGRTPVSQGTGKTRGRDHHADCFSIWMAGAGLKPGFAWGESDEVGRRPVANPVTVYDLHATALRLLGLDHERLTYYHNGTRRRLTDVHGHVVDQLFA